MKLSALGVAGGLAACSAPAATADADSAQSSAPAESNTGILGSDDEADTALTLNDLRAAQRIANLSFRDEHLEMALEAIDDRRSGYDELRAIETPNDLVPALLFEPRIGGTLIPKGPSWLPFDPDTSVSRPDNDTDLAFMSVAELAGLIIGRHITSVELTNVFLERLERIGPQLEAVVTITRERAIRHARAADAELAGGVYRGPLHGIPYGAKDLLSVAGYPTTWGAVPYQDQTIEKDAAVISLLDDAGAILVAKLTLGALAWGDVWFAGMTRNPWNVEEGSSGSSAGPGSAVAAGLVPFAIGSETLGSIVSPSTRNGVTGHRPSFGTISRSGAMTLSWSMDKLGPMTRSALDCALVFDAIRGADDADHSSIDMQFAFDPTSDLSRLRIGYLADAFNDDYRNKSADAATLDTLRRLGADLVPVKWPDSVPVGPLLTTLSVEAASAFDELTRTNGVDTMVRQIPNAWPNEFRAARFVPAVEFLQANRHRVTLMRAMAEVMADFDVVVSPSFRGGTLQITNLTGHPSVCVPNNFLPVDDHPERKSPQSITFVGALYNDSAALRVAHAYQEATDWHKRRPPIGG